MKQLDQKINAQFPGMVVRKDLANLVKGNAIVPSYVLEYLLGQYCATSDGPSIQSGVETVKEILRKHYVHRSEAGLIRSTIRERGRHKVIDKVSVDLNEKRDAYEASFANLGIRKVLVDVDTIKRYPRLLVSGIWCIAELEYQFSEEGNAVPWMLEALKPIQLSRFDFAQYLEARHTFTSDEWIDLLIQSIGFDPQLFGRRSKLLQLVRLVPYCERNYNLIELGPKGTGKSHIYTEFSPHGILISGGEVTVPKLFVNNASGRIGLVGFWDVVAFDEFAGKKRVDKALVDILKNYMANKSFSRGIDTLGADASMAFVGNTQHTLPYMLRHSDLFAPLPEMYHDSAFLDRQHFYIPGWEMDIIRSEMFSTGYGFVVDYLAEILRHLRDHDYSQHYSEHFELMSELSTRDRTGIQKTFSGLMKLLYPHKEATPAEIEELLRIAIEGRKRVKDQLMRIDPTYTAVNFAYMDVHSREIRHVQTLEEKMYPQHYGSPGSAGGTDETADLLTATLLTPASGEKDSAPKSQERRLSFEENARGVSFETLFGAYLAGAQEITVSDPDIRSLHQARNMMELLETVVRIKDTDAEVHVHLVTSRDASAGEPQEKYLQQIQTSAATAGINFTWEFADRNTLHTRYISSDTGWKIMLGRGLDIFQRYEMHDTFAIANRVQTQRSVKAFEITYLRTVR